MNSDKSYLSADGICCLKSNIRKRNLRVLTRLMKMVLENQNRISSRSAKVKVVESGCYTCRIFFLQEDQAQSSLRAEEPEVLVRQSDIPLAVDEESIQQRSLDNLILAADRCKIWVKPIPSQALQVPIKIILQICEQ